jgi:hypothetical protein
MGHIVTTIIPIFSLVILGTLARSKGFLPRVPGTGEPSGVLHGHSGNILGRVTQAIMS